MNAISRGFITLALLLCTGVALCEATPAQATRRAREIARQSRDPAANPIRLQASKLGHGSEIPIVAVSEPELPLGPTWPAADPVSDNVPPLDGEILPPLLSNHVESVIRQILLLTIPALAAMLLLQIIPRAALLLTGSGADLQPLPGARGPVSPFDSEQSQGPAPGIDADAVRKTSAAGCGRTILDGLSLTLIGVGAILFYFSTVRPQQKVAASAGWLKTPCVVFSTSEFGLPDVGNSADFFPWQIHFRYRDPLTHAPRNSGQFNFNPESVLLPVRNPAIGRHYPPQTQTYCYVDPNHPAMAVLQRSMGEESGAEAIAFGLAAMGLVGLLSRFLWPRGIPGVSADGAVMLSNSQIQRSGRTVGYPPPPHNSGPVPYRSTELRQREFVVMLRAALICLAIAVTSIWAILAFGGRGFVWLAAVAPTIPSIILTTMAFRRMQKLSAPAINIVLSRPLEPGRAVELQWSFTGNFTPIDRLTISLVGHEEVTYTRSNETSTDRRALPDEVLLQASQAGRLGHGKGIVNLTPRHMHTFTGDNNALRWEFKVRTELPATTTEDLFPVVIYPAGAVK